MRARVPLILGAVLVFVAIETNGSADAQGSSQTVNVDVRVDCLAGRGVSFSLTPWSISMKPGDSINWRLDAAANVTEMEVKAKATKPWPFKKKTGYKSKKNQPAGAKELDAAEKGSKYQYVVSAICVRDAAMSDTVIIDPDIIIIR